MKTFKQILSLIIVISIITSCLDDKTLTDDFANGSNLIGFDKSSTAYSVKADGNIYTKSIAVNATGPTFTDINQDVTVTYDIDPSSTAVAGVNYNLVPGTITLTSANNLISSIPVEILTAGMSPPMDELQLVLNITSISGGNNLVINGRKKQIIVKINYLCSSDLEGAYHMNFTSGVTPINITQIGDGLYRSDYLPPFSNRYWFEFSDVCDELRITTWQYQGGNPITPLNTVVGSVDEQGNLVFEGINVGGVSWYVDRDFTILKN